MVKRIFALFGAVLLAGMYLLTLYFALTDSSYTKGMLMASIAATIIVPVMLYGYIVLYRLLKKDNRRETSNEDS
ncbi:MAG: hypothetical protein K6G83_03520 [Lachnospiraceae bacterium]|nr:hypothetical protein [Lachnospiraceae bacterium]